ncbi:MAG: copper chaperone PCu(A)C [Gammaproteobacteria bacterium]|nr:copper chaperone PCu(A)C [Gammaproteobacteria bacterium]
MFHYLNKRDNAILSIVFSFALFTSSSHAAVTQVEDAWVREAPPSSTTLAAYMRLFNSSATDLIITNISSPAFKKIEVHQTTTKNNIVKMRKLERVSIPAHGELILEPGQKHLMLFKPNLKLKTGDAITLNIRFENGKQQEIRAEVKKANDMNHQQNAHTHH